MYFLQKPQTLRASWEETIFESGLISTMVIFIQISSLRSVWIFIVPWNFYDIEIIKCITKRFYINLKLSQLQTFLLSSLFPDFPSPPLSTFFLSLSLPPSYILFSDALIKPMHYLLAKSLWVYILNFIFAFLLFYMNYDYI